MNMLHIKNNKMEYNLLIKSTIFIYILTVYLSLFTSLTSTYLGGVAVHLIYFIPILLFFLFPVNKEFIRKDCQSLYFKMLLWFFTFVFTYFIFFQLVSSKNVVKNFIVINIEVSFFNLIAIIPVFVISYYLLKVKPMKYNKKLMECLLTIILINIAFTLKLIIKDPNAAKILATTEGMSIYGLTGASGFNITYSVVLLVPIFLYGMNKFNKLKKILWIGMTILNLVFIYKCGYTLAILATVLIIVLYIFFSLNSIYRFLLIIPSIFIIYTAVNTDFIYQLLITLSYKIDIYEVSKRFVDIANMIKFGDTSAASLRRLDLYFNSLNAFIKSPIVGIFPYVSNYDLSRHSTILDILGGTGLIGTIPFCLSIFYAFRASIRYIRDFKYKKCIYSAYIVFLFMAFLNPIFNSPTILFTLIAIVPMMSILFDNEQSSNNADPKKDDF